MRYFLFFFFLIVSMSGYAESPTVYLEKAPIQPDNIKSVERGGKFFATNCMVCHTLIYLRYNKLARKVGVLYEKMPINVKEWPFGIKPPDLSLEANYRGVDWIYTYLHSFYADTSRPTGVNNLVLPNTAMAGILVPYQGKQILLSPDKFTKHSFNSEYQWYDLLELDSPGTMTSQQFDDTITDVVNFLYYAAEPYQHVQHRIGYWVIGFLLLFFVLTFYLKKMYWKDLTKK